MIIPILLVIAAALALIVVSERRLNGRLTVQMNHYRREYYKATERANKAETELNGLRRVRKSQ